MRLIWPVLVVTGSICVLAVACSGREAPNGLNPTTGSYGAGGEDFVSAIASPSSTGSGETRISDPNAPCDAQLAFDSNDPFDAAGAMGICTRAQSDEEWGLIDARWTMANGDPAIVHPNFSLGHGILDDFGAQSSPQEGERFLALSSGTARQPGHPDYEDVEGFAKGYISATPNGYPKEAPACPGVVTGATHDDVALEVVLRAPPKAESLAFDFNFFTFEWPEFICSPFNDYFLAFLTPLRAGQTDPNISFDSEGNVVSVNNGLLRVCGCASGPPCEAPPGDPLIFYDCEEGQGELSLTGFEGAAATSWLVTRAPVAPDEVVTLRWMVFDSGDGVLDSTVVMDNFRWLGDPEMEPVTQPK